MVCCTMGAMALVTGVLWCRKRIDVIRFAPATALAASVLVLSVLTAEHLGHYVERAHANDRPLLAEFLAQPVCTGTPAEPAAAPGSAR